MVNLTRIIVGGKVFKFPTSQIKFIQRWKELDHIEGQTVCVVNRDADIFAFIHRWLCGYPAHLPPTEWETICLLADCENVYGTLKLRQELLSQLREQDTSLGRKARILLTDDLELNNQAFITDTWAKISEPALFELTPAVRQLCADIAKILESSDQHHLKIVAPILKIVSQQSNLCEGVLQYLMRQHGIIPQVELLTLIKWVLAWNIRPPIVPESTDQNETIGDELSDSSVPPLVDSDEDPGTPETPTISSDVENPTSAKRTIPPPKKIQLPLARPLRQAYSMIDLGMENIRKRFGTDLDIPAGIEPEEEDAGVRVFASE